MTVKELRKSLSKLPQNAEVGFSSPANMKFRVAYVRGITLGYAPAYDLDIVILNDNSHLNK